MCTIVAQSAVRNLRLSLSRAFSVTATLKKMTTEADIPTWKKYAETNTLQKKIDVLPNRSIDNSKNASLSEKISIFCGDITSLKVRIKSIWYCTHCLCWSDLLT